MATRQLLRNPRPSSSTAAEGSNMSDLGKLFRLRVSGPKPLENFTTTALSIAINHDQRPIVQALRKVDRSGHESAAFQLLDLFRVDTERVTVAAAVQKALWPIDDIRLGTLILYLPLGIR